ncbi:hypothetical protein BASA50_000193 [Batrachochytrium salamandrivorans]|uniref:Pentacotripeptide-repeat region of PRORP domain-containing protein n=1 Tax=Batrachochytrium salamandrivorans TaxID=1357716 RepID=A0ABQ8EVJ5_9FUNG|nr:hypothetical protein BASA60_002904 [Batrachochytrium salamandrivorans]KAH6586829.1 hypothetical protein BASA50_000193 [Batrachochytrium salamandrivorans]KAH9266911.1 hypothetical protein BASA83_010264 [Batrachochytrium salamandrivorans]
MAAIRTALRGATSYLSLPHHARTLCHSTVLARRTSCSSGCIELARSRSLLRSYLSTSVSNRPKKDIDVVEQSASPILESDTNSLDDTESPHNDSDALALPTNANKVAPRPKGVHASSQLTHLIHAVDSGDFSAAVNRFNKLKELNSSLLANLPPRYWSSIITRIFHRNQGILTNSSIGTRTELAVSALLLMESLGVPHNISTIKCAIDVYGKVEDFEKVNELIKLLNLKGYRPGDTSMLAIICRAYIRCGKDDLGLKEFDKLFQARPGVESYTFLLKTFAEKDSERGVLYTIKRMQMSKLRIDATMASIIADFYYRQKNYSIAKKHISMFKTVGGVLTPEMYITLAKIGNATGDYNAVLEIHREMTVQHIPYEKAMKFEMIIAYAGLGDTNKMWMAYQTALQSGIVDVSPRVAMAKALGSISGTDIIEQIKLMSMYLLIEPYRAIEDLVRGYAIIGDVASVKALVAILEIEQKIYRISVQGQVIVAYNVSGDADGALAYAKFLDKKYGDKIDYGIWGNVLTCVMRLKPELVEEVVAHITTKYPNILIRDELRIARSAISKQSSHFVRYPKSE